MLQEANLPRKQRGEAKIQGPGEIALINWSSHVPCEVIFLYLFGV